MIGAVLKVVAGTVWLICLMLAGWGIYAGWSIGLVVVLAAIAVACLVVIFMGSDVPHVDVRQAPRDVDHPRNV